MRINLYAGPCSGKSTTAALIYGMLKKDGYSVELVTEYIKRWAIENRKITGFDQIYFMGKQIYNENRLLTNGIEYVVSDSPVLLSACYTRVGFPELKDVANSMENIMVEYERHNPSINIFLNRLTDSKSPYKKEGRLQTYQEALNFDMHIKDMLNRLEIPFVEFSVKDIDVIFQHVKYNILWNNIDDTPRTHTHKRVN